MTAFDRDVGGVFLLGCPRSGTTILRRLLDQHHEIACPGETFLPRAAARFLEGEQINLGLSYGVLGGLPLLGFSSSEIRTRLRELVFSFLNEYAQKRKKRIWIEKTAVNVFHTRSIDELFGDHVRYLCLFRNGLDVVVSMEDLIRATGVVVEDLRPYVERWPRLHVAFAQAWVDASQNMLDLMERRPAMSLRIKYEDVVADPAAELRRIVGFLGVDWQEGLDRPRLGSDQEVGFGDWKTYARPSVGGESVGRWREGLRTSLPFIAPIVNPMLERLGYETVEAGPPPSEEDAARRYELDLLQSAARSGQLEG